MKAFYIKRVEQRWNGCGRESYVCVGWRYIQKRKRSDDRGEKREREKVCKSRASKGIKG